MKLLLKKLMDTLLCCLLAGSFGWFIAHEYERWHPREKELVYIYPEKPPEVNILKPIRVGNKTVWKGCAK